MAKRNPVRVELKPIEPGALMGRFKVNGKSAFRYRVKPSENAVDVYVGDDKYWRLELTGKGKGRLVFEF